MSRCLGGRDTANRCCHQKVFVDSISRDVVESSYGRLANLSKGCFQPTFYRDVVAATSQSSKMSQNRVFDVSRDPKTAEITTSPKILSIFYCFYKIFCLTKRCRSRTSNATD